MKDFIESLFYFLRKHKEWSIVIGLLTLQFISFLPLLTNVLSAKMDFEKMEKEALNRRYEENAAGVDKTVSLNPFDYYWKEGQKDLFLRPKKTASPVTQIVEQKRTAPLNYVGLYRTEKDVTAMVKNTETGKSYFCKKGEKIDSFRVVDIKRDILVVSADSGELIHLKKGGKEEVGY